MILNVQVFTHELNYEISYDKNDVSIFFSL